MKRKVLGRGLDALLPAQATGEAETEELESIEGTPPDLYQELTLCPFAPRCDYAFDRCWEKVPPLIKVGAQHSAACFYDVERGGSRDGI